MQEVEDPLSGEVNSLAYRLNIFTLSFVGKAKAVVWNLFLKGT
jgi:hypothetical protein